MGNIWVVRAGQGNEAVERFQEDAVVAYGGARIGDLRVLRTREAIRQKVADLYPEHPRGAVANWAGQYWKIYHEIHQGDLVLTPIQATREIMLGTITGDYEFHKDHPDGYPHFRKVRWVRTVTRDVFPPATRNALGSTLSIFSMSHHRETIEGIFGGTSQASITPDEVESPDGQVDLYEETRSKADEIIADLLHKRDPYEFQELVAAVLRAMGMRTKTSSPGPDRGVDIVAYPDALGFGTPRIKVQVKHRKGAATGPEMRNFMSTLAHDEKGLFVSTGGFTKDALDEPERRGKPVTLLDQDKFIELMLEHYENMETSYQAWIPLRRLYIPVVSED